MRQSKSLYLVLVGAILIALSFTLMAQTQLVLAQGPSATATETQPALTPTATPTETPTATPTEVVVEPTPTATATPTEVVIAPTATPTATPTDVTQPPQPPAPVEIPEPITVVLFGTGLAALSAAAAARRKKNGANDGE